MASFVELIVEHVVNGLPAAAAALVPVAVRRQVVARCNDFIPFGNISANHDLLRAARLSWIEATNTIRRAVREQVGDGPRRDEMAMDFDSCLQARLIDIRSEAYDRSVTPSACPIDQDIQAIIDGAAEFTSATDHRGIGEHLNSRFERALAELTGWDHVPEIFVRTAKGGVLSGGDMVARSFGELVFASFAELIKDPRGYFEAREAFHIAAQKRVLDVAKQNRDELEIMRHDFLEGMELLRAELAAKTILALEQCLPAVQASIDKSNATKVLEQGLEHYLRGQSAQLQRIEQKIHELVEQTAQAEGVPAAMLNAVRLEMGADTFALTMSELGERLVNMARHYRQLLDRLNYLSNDDPLVAALRQSAAKDIEAGRFAQADARLAEAEARDLAGLDEVEQIARQKRLSAAKTRAARGEAALILGSLSSYRQAVLHFAAAREIAAPVSPEAAHQYGVLQCQTLYWIGSSFGRNNELHEAVVLSNSMLDPSLGPGERAAILAELGRVHLVLGRRQPGQKELEQAVAELQEAIRLYQEVGDSADCTSVYLNLGHALRALAYRLRTPEMFGEAVETIRSLPRTIPLSPDVQAQSWTDIGHTMLIAGKSLGTDWSHSAVEAYREALKVISISDAPLRYASALSNLGLALLDTGDEKGLAYLRQSVDVHRQVLDAEVKARYPSDWAVMQNNLGALLRFLAWKDGEDQIGCLRAAVDVHGLAIDRLSDDRNPIELATSRVALGNALVDLGEYTNDPAPFALAVTSYQLAGRTFEGTLDSDWAGTMSNMGYALRIHGEYHMRRDEGHDAVPLLKRAAAAYDAAAKVYETRGSVNFRQKAEADRTACLDLLRKAQASSAG